MHLYQQIDRPPGLQVSKGLSSTVGKVTHTLLEVKHMTFARVRSMYYVPSLTINLPQIHSTFYYELSRIFLPIKCYKCLQAFYVTPGDLLPVALREQ